MARPVLSPRRYRIATMSALVFLFVIVVSGALVRLTDSGLGCADWPNCNASKFVDVSSTHSAIEQVNRLFTGAVTIAVALAVLGAVFRVPRRRDLTWLSAGLVVGVLGQAILGAVVVWSHLNPVAVQGHFLLSMALMADALVLHRRAAQPDGGRVEPTVPAPIRRHAWATTAMTGVALVTGTVVTGAGPHSGSVDGDPVRRFGVAVSSAARVHSLAVWATLALLAALAWRVRNRPAVRRPIEAPMTVLGGLALVQGAIGYIQYFSGVPIVLVAIHVGFATGVWLAAVNLGLVTTKVVASASPADVRPVSSAPTPAPLATPS
jgi:cytochrome c oxidase assembly protein subunit 15